MADTRACLVDVYDTIVSCDFLALIMRECGVDPRLDLVRALVDKDNCTEYTRELLIDFGVAARADALVLSCEVGAAKPAAQIFRHALDQLDVTAGAALFVDDQATYCAGAVALGITTVQIVRGELDGTVPAAGTTKVVRSLPEVEAMLWG